MTLLLIDSEVFTVSISILIPSSGSWLSTQTKIDGARLAADVHQRAGYFIA